MSTTTQKQYKKLIMVTPDNNNKYYEMIWEGGSTFTVNYGRVESTKQTCTYSYSHWNSKYNEKVKKGYKDVTDLVAVEVHCETTQTGPKKYKDIEDAKVAAFVAAMQAYTNGLVARTYSVKSDRVSQAQVDKAQAILDDLAELAKAPKVDKTVVNTKLVELYTIIPRYIKDVRQAILPHIDLDKTLVQEQDNLDAMRSQVNVNVKNEAKKKKTPEKQEPEQTFLDVLGVQMKEIISNEEIEYYVKQVSGKSVKAVFEVCKPREDADFHSWLSRQKDKRTSIVLHGTKCTSVVPILEQGLKIRPTGNFQFTGKVYGNGNYFSEEPETSLGYTGCDKDKVLLVYEVHTGNPFVYGSRNGVQLNYRSLQQNGYDCTVLAGYRSKRRQMVIAYNETQSRIRYIIWLKQ